MSKTDHAHHDLMLRCPATLHTVDDVDAALIRLLDTLGVTERRFEMRIVCREALLNAVIHGSDQHADRTIEIQIDADADALQLRIADEGTGFLHTGTHHIPTAIADGGRGLPLMHHYSDELMFNAAGNEVTMRFHFGGDPHHVTAPELEENAP
ncbi:MAG: ATP-binding protein [Planctomycetota bacterium]